MSATKEQFDTLMASLGLPFVKEYRFHPVRLWRFDYYFPTLNVAFEYDGLGRGHTGVKGVLNDTDKINEAQMLGICVYRVNTRTVSNGVAEDLVRRVVAKHGVPASVAHKRQRNRQVQHDQDGQARPAPQAKRSRAGVPAAGVRHPRNARSNHDDQGKGKQ